MTEKSLSAWRKLFGRHSDEDGVEEMNSILLQIVLAVMLIFMIAFFLFMGKVDGEISRLDELHQKMEQADRSELLHLVDQLTQRYRIRYGLTEFLHIDPATGEKTYDFSDVITRGNQVAATPEARAFRIGAQAAFDDYRNILACQEKWMREMRELAPETAVRHQAWLREVVSERVVSLKKEVVEVQQLAAAAIQQHLALHPAEVRDPQIRRLLTQLGKTQDSPERSAQMAELARQLKKLAYLQLAELCHAPMLAGEEK